MSYANDLQTRRAAALFTELKAELYTAERYWLALRTRRLGQLLRAAQPDEWEPSWAAEGARLNTDLTQNNKRSPRSRR